MADVNFISSLIGGIGLGGNAIGAAIVRLRLDSDDYQRQMATAHAQTTTSANAMSSSMSKFAAISKVALLGVGIAAVAGAALSVKAAIEANEAHLKLQNTFKNNEKLSDSSVAAFERQAESLRALTGVDDEAIISSQALLGQFELTGKEVQALIPRVVDLSAKLGIDLDAAAKAVGKSTQGSAGILQRYGIQVDDARMETDAFGATLDALGKVQGFAAERAEAEPWRILASEFEELAEDVGHKLVPILRDLIAAFQDLMPVITAILGPLGDAIALAAEAVSALAKVVTLQFDELKSGITDAAVVFEGLLTKFDAGEISALELSRALNNLHEETGFNIELTDDLTQTLAQAEDGFRRGRQAANEWNKIMEAQQDAVGDTRKAIGFFAKKTDEELEEWSDDVKESFDSFVLVLDESTEATKITRREFIDATDAMQREARQLARAMREIAGEKWINEEYIAFLSAQGPEWMIGFTRLTEEEQRRAQQAWKETTSKTDAAKESLDRITGVLKDMDNRTTKHTVEVEYKYTGFDPSKPGMAGVQKSQ